MNDFNNNQIVQQPKDLDVKLYIHQLASIYNMEKLEVNNTISIGNNTYRKTKLGIIADMVGYGKTLSMLGLIIRNKMEWDIDMPYVLEKTKIEAEGLIKKYEILRYTKLPATLVLMSQSIIGQWVQELSHTKLKYTCIKTKQDLTELQAEDYDIVLVIPSMYNKLVTVYSNCTWKRFIFDEPGNLKVPGMLEVRAGFYWFMSATPQNIFHHHYRCSKNTFMRDIVGSSYSEFENISESITIKNNPDFIKMSFKMPETFHNYHKCYQPIYNIINNFVSSHIKNMIEAGNIEGAILELGGNKTSNIVELIMEKKKNELLEIDAKIQLYTIRNDEEKINELHIKKSKINIQIKELDEKFKTMLSSPCNICYGELKDPVLEFNCQNLFCGECLLTWLRNKNSCPLCRITIDTKDLIYIDNNEHENNTILEKKEKPITKPEKIIEIIQNNMQGKFLIFSDHDGSFNSINQILKEYKISCVQIRGNVRTTESNLNSFKHGDTQVIFLNSRYNGAGLNLQEATDIILYHEMNFNTETQIIGRANRIGRQIPLNVHHLQIQENL